mgnify:CR=1 FL=1
MTKERIRSEEQEIRDACSDMTKFSVLYDRYFTQVFRFVYKRVESEAVAADLTQTVFLKAMQALPKFRFEGYPEEQISLILLYIKKLKADELELVEMRYFEERPYHEIAEILGINENTAMVRLHRVIQKIRSNVTKASHGKS